MVSGRPPFRSVTGRDSYFHLLSNEIPRRLYHLAAGDLRVAVDFDDQPSGPIGLGERAAKAGEIALARAEQHFLSGGRVAQMEYRDALAVTAHDSRGSEAGRKWIADIEHDRNLLRIGFSQDGAENARVMLEFLRVVMGTEADAEIPADFS